VSKRRIRWRDQDSLDWYDRASLWIWLPVSFVYLSVTMVQFFGRETYTPWMAKFDWVMSAAFAIDYALRFYMAPGKLRFVRHYWNIADALVIATPLVALRFGSGVTGLVRILRVVRLSAIAKRVWDGSSGHFGRGQVKWMAIAAAAIVFLASLTVWAAENNHQGSSIHTPLDAVWWSVVTMFTVGYGEMYPQTVAGKVFAIVLMVAGIALFSWVTAAVASMFVESESEVKATSQRDAMQDQMDAMARQLARMERHLAILVGQYEDALDTENASLDPRETTAQAVAAVSAVRESDSDLEAASEESTMRAARRWVAARVEAGWGRWKSVCRTDVFWFCVSMLLCALALVQALVATASFWPAAILAAAIFCYVALLRIPKSGCGWGQWVVLLLLAVLLAANVVDGWAVGALLVGGVWLAGFELRTALGWPPMPEEPKGAPGHGEADLVAVEGSHGSTERGRLAAVKEGSTLDRH